MDQIRSHRLEAMVGTRFGLLLRGGHHSGVSWMVKDFGNIRGRFQEIIEGGGQHRNLPGGLKTLSLWQWWFERIGGLSKSPL